jgi:hypothetical protein
MADSRPTFLDLQGKKRSELLKLKLEIGSDIDNIKGQLDKAKHEYRKTGRRMDEDWFRRAKSVLRIKGRQVQQIQIQLAGLRDDKKRQIPLLFMQKAEELLDKETFERVLDAAIAATGVEQENK